MFIVPSYWLVCMHILLPRHDRYMLPVVHKYILLPCYCKDQSVLLYLLQEILTKCPSLLINQKCNKESAGTGKNVRDQVCSVFSLKLHCNQWNWQCISFKSKSNSYDASISLHHVLHLSSVPWYSIVFYQAIVVH